MPTKYAVVADIASELKELFGDGFTPATEPSDTEICDKIAEVTTGLRVRVVRALGEEPLSNDDAAQLVKRGIVAKVTAWVLRRKLVGYAAADIASKTGPYDKDYTEVLKEIEMLPDLFRRETTTAQHVGQTAVGNRRKPILADDAIGRLDTF